MQSKLLLSDSCAILLWTFLSACLGSASKQQWEQQNCFKQMTHVKAKLCANKNVLKSTRTSIQGTSSTHQWIVLERCILQKLPPAAHGCHKNRQAPQCVSPGILNMGGVKRLTVELPRNSHVSSDQKKRKVCWVTRFPKDSPFCSTLEPAVSIGNTLKPPEMSGGLGNLYALGNRFQQVARCSLLWSKNQTQRNLAILYSFPLVDPDVAASRRTPPWKIERLPAVKAAHRMPNDTLSHNCYTSGSPCLM